MAKIYRDVMSKYRRREKEIHPAYLNDPLYVHAMEKVAPYIWMDLSFAEELQDIIYKTADSIENKLDRIDKQIRKIEDSIRSQSVLTDPRSTYKKAVIAVTEWARRKQTYFEEREMPKVAEAFRFGSYLRLSHRSIDPKPMQEYEATREAFDQFARPPYPIFWLNVPFKPETPDQPHDIVGVLIEENPTEHLHNSDIPAITRGTWTLSNLRVAASHHLGRRKPIQARYRAFFFHNSLPLPYCAYYVDGFGSMLKPFGLPYDEHNSDWRNDCARIAFQKETVLTLLNTRNSPFTNFRDPALDRRREEIKKMSDAERDAYLRRLKTRNERPGGVVESYVTFDLSPFRKLEQFRHMPRRQLLDIIKQQFVRGHFKLIKRLGFRWWRFHVRGADISGQIDTGDMPREGRVIASNPTTPLKTPDGKYSFGHPFRRRGNRRSKKEFNNDC